MELDKNDWTMIGIGIGGILAGAVGASLFSRSKEQRTGLSRLYRMAGTRKGDVVIEIWAGGDGYFLSGEAPYGIVNGQGEPDEDLENQWGEDIAEAKNFPEPEDAAEAADDLMKNLSYIAVDQWTDSLQEDLKEETA